VFVPRVYVDEKAISQLTTETMQEKPFSLRRFKIERYISYDLSQYLNSSFSLYTSFSLLGRDYRAAVVEAVRIQIANDVKLSSSCLDNIQTFSKACISQLLPIHLHFFKFLFD